MVQFRFSLLVFILVTVNAAYDLNTDKEALVSFANLVPHQRALNWDDENPICSYWIGVMCDSGGTRVIALHLPAIGLLGSIPANTLGKLDYLQLLSLRYNLLSGNIPLDVTTLPSLKYVFLQNNNFSGKLPVFLSYHISILDLSFNSFTGKISPMISYLFQLRTLILSNNSLTGEIPDLNSLQRLKYFNLSYNNLHGLIPSSLQKFSNSSFLGNPGLCGSPLPKCPPSPPLPLPPPPSMATSTTHPHKRSKKKLSTILVITIVISGSAILLLIVIIFLLFYLRSKSKEDRRRLSKGKAVVDGGGSSGINNSSSGPHGAEMNKLTFFDGSSFSFNLEDLLRASAEILGKGSYGTTYKAVLEDGMTAVVVKRLREVVVGKKDFEQQMEMLGRLSRHPNVVPLRAYYYSKEEKLLVYDYLPLGNLTSILHGSKTDGRTPLDLESRVRMALGVARGLWHIHSQGGGKFFHGNLKSNNVLLNRDFDGSCISDFGIVPLMNIPATPRNLVGYRAPEAILSKKFTKKSDVYSFGVILLELLTGKAPQQSPGRDDISDLPRWVRSVVKEEWTAEVFDKELLAMRQNIQDDMLQMLQIAMLCVDRHPDRRPTIDQVIGMLEDLQTSDSDNRPSSN